MTTIREICYFEAHAVHIEEAIQACNDEVLFLELDESDVIGVSVLPPDPRAVAEGVKDGSPPRVRVVMTYWRHVPIG